MTITRYSNDLPSLIGRQASMLNHFFSGDLMAPMDIGGNNSNYSSTNTSLPKVNIMETEDDFILEVAAPGMKKEDFNIEFDNGKLAISSEVERKDDENLKYKRREFSYQSFKRTFNVAIEMVDADKINAKYQDGILVITLPKREEIKPKPARNIKIS